MRSIAPIGLATLILLLSACGTAPVITGWQGEDVHLVDGTWIGTERACGAGDGYADVVCHTVVDLTMAALPSDERSKVTKAFHAELPSTFVTAAGETRTAEVSVGILTRTAVVVELVDGARRVIGLLCYLPSSGTGRLSVANSTCELVPLGYWRDGYEPPQYP